MDTQCTYCCGLFWIGKKSSVGREANSSSKPGIVKRISKEHLLSYASGENDKAAQNGANSRSPAQLILYCPPYKQNVSSHGSLVLPLLRVGVKETRHEFRSKVSIIAFLPLPHSSLLKFLSLKQLVAGSKSAAIKLPTSQ